MQFDPMWFLSGLLKVYALALLILAVGCAAAVVIAALIRPPGSQR